MNFLVRLFSKIQQTNECWIWTGAAYDGGYGCMRVGGKRHGVHRIIWELYNGPIPNKMEVCHTCDNPPCCNPEHLELGTHSKNIKDAYERQCIPSRQGSGNTFAKLNERSVKRIRGLVKTKHDLELAAMFKVSRTTIRDIRNRRTWVHI